jgi:hypothetical protein
MLPHNAKEFPLAGTGYALLTKTGEEEDLRLHIELNDRLNPVFGALAQDLVHMGSNQRKISLVDKDKAELDITFDGDQVVFNILNPQVTQYGLMQMPFRRNPTYNDVFPVIHASAHYYRHLRLNNASKSLQNQIELVFTRLEEAEETDEDLNTIHKPVGSNLNVAGVVDLIIDPNDDPDDPRDLYGIKIVNNSNFDLYPSLFYFDNSDLSISKSIPVKGVSS